MFYGDEAHDVVVMTHVESLLVLSKCNVRRLINFIGAMDEKPKQEIAS